MNEAVLDNNKKPSKMADISLYLTEAPGPSPVEVDTCVLEIKKKHEVIPTIVCSICFAIGLMYCFLGYRCFKTVMFLSGFLLGSAAVCLLYNKEPVLDTQLGMETKAGISLGVGVLCGLVTMLVHTMGLFLMGLQLGCLLILATLVAVGHFYSLTPMWVPLTAFLTTSIVTAVFALQWQKLLTVISTAALGATAVMLCVDFLVETFTLAGHVYDILYQIPPHPLCWPSWAITGICPVVGLIGVLVQWKVTAVGVSHKEAAHKKQQKNGRIVQYKYRESRRRAGTNRCRKPPPLKRYAGDVLAPSYLQSLQERQMGTGSSSSSVSTITHTVVDFDFDTRSMVPLTPSSPVLK